MEKQSTGRVVMKLVVSVLALFLLMACGVFFGACKSKEAHQHSYQESTSENSEATCGATGYKIFACSCGDRYAVATPATGKHNFVAGYCSSCGLPDIYDDDQLLQLLNDINSKIQQTQQSINDIHMHDFSADSITVSPTCHASGFIAQKCACGSSAITASLDVLPHQWDDNVIEVPATCTSVGEIWKKCVNCNDTILFQTIEAKGHSYSSEMKVIKAATCTEEGYKAYQCDACGEISHSEKIPATGHSMKWETKTTNPRLYAANCLHGDMTWYHCINENCSANWGEPTEVSEKGEHRYENDYEGNQILKEATCTEPATIQLICTACNTEKGSVITGEKAKGHSWERVDANGNLVVDLSKLTSESTGVSNYSAPTCSQVGGFTYTCEDCDATIPYIIPINPDAHKLLSETPTTTYSQLTGDLESSQYNWNTVTYTHYLCEYCRGWLIKNEDVPEGRNPLKPSEAKKTEGEGTGSGSEAGGTEGTEGGGGGIIAGLTADATSFPYTLITREFFDYQKKELNKEMEDWSDIIKFSWHSWSDFDKDAKEGYNNEGKQKDDYGNDVSIGDATCTTPGLHYYKCKETGGDHVEHVITPAVGHNFEVPNTVDGFRELYWKTITDDVEEEDGQTDARFDDREDHLIGADCTDYGVLFISCVNCFEKDKSGHFVYKGSRNELDEEEIVGDDIKYCDGDDTLWGDGTRIAITVIDGKLVTVKMDFSITHTQDESHQKNILRSDEEVADNVRNLEEYLEGKEGEGNTVDAFVTDVYSSHINSDTIEKLYAAFLGNLPKSATEGSGTPGTGAGTGSETGSDGSHDKTDYSMFLADVKNAEKKYVFDPLGHSWAYDEKPTEGSGSTPAPARRTTWDVLKPPVPEDEEDELEETETYDCTRPGYSGRYCERACCDGNKTEVLPDEETEEEDKKYDEPHQYDLHQRVELKKGELSEADKPYAYDLGRVDRNGLEYYIIATETDKRDTTDKATDIETRKAELTYEELNDLYELLVEREHEYKYDPKDDNAKCGDKVDVKVTCKNCNRIFDDDKMTLEHLGHFGTYFTIGSCGTAYGQDHSIVTYDYCLDCGKRVGLEYSIKKDATNKEMYDEEGNPIWVFDDQKVLWTEGDTNNVTGKPVDLLPCPIVDNKVNYRHFPFNREVIENLLKVKTTKEVDGKQVTELTPNYKLYSALWKAIDEWYLNNLDSKLFSSALSGFLMTESLTDKANGWTARCYDCYTEVYSHKCTKENGSLTTGTEGESGTAEDTTQKVWFLVENGVIEEVWQKKDIRELAAIEMLIDAKETENEKKAEKDQIDVTLLSDYLRKRAEELGITEEEITTKRWSLQDTGDYNLKRLPRLVQAYVFNHANCDAYSAEVTKCGHCGAYSWEIKDKNNPLTLEARPTKKPVYNGD